jgi:hypothetical protein
VCDGVGDGDGRCARHNGLSSRRQPVLHFGETRLQKHRIDKPRLIQFLEEWKARETMQGDHSSQ